MDSFFSDLNHIGTLGTLISWVIAAFFAGLYFFDKSIRDRRKENDDLADDLIQKLKQKVEQLEADRTAMQTEMARHTHERNTEMKELHGNMENLKGRNAILEELFKGRDPIQDKVFKEALGVFEIARQNHALATENGKEIRELTETINEFLQTLKPLFEKLGINP